MEHIQSRTAYPVRGDNAWSRREGGGREQDRICCPLSDLRGKSKQKRNLFINTSVIYVSVKDTTIHLWSLIQLGIVQCPVLSSYSTTLPLCLWTLIYCFCKWWTFSSFTILTWLFLLCGDLPYFCILANSYILHLQIYLPSMNSLLCKVCSGWPGLGSMVQDRLSTTSRESKYLHNQTSSCFLQNSTTPSHAGPSCCKNWLGSEGIHECVRITWLRILSKTFTFAHCDMILWVSREWLMTNW